MKKLSDQQIMFIIFIVLFVGVGGFILYKTIDAGQTPLHKAVLAQDFEEVEKLINNGADVNAATRLKRTPLHMAASNGNTRILALLLAKGASINAQDSNAETPLHSTMYEGYDSGTKHHYNVIRREAAIFLIDMGADLTIKNSSGQTPMDEARDFKADDLVEYIQAHQSLKK